jgi:hypothetical protein
MAAGATGDRDVALFPLSEGVDVSGSKIIRIVMPSILPTVWPRR